MLQFMGLQRVGHNLETERHTSIKRKKSKKKDMQIRYVLTHTCKILPSQCTSASICTETLSHQLLLKILCVAHMEKPLLPSSLLLIFFFKHYLYEIQHT